MNSERGLTAEQRSAAELFRRRVLTNAAWAGREPYRTTLRRDPCIYCCAWPLPAMGNAPMTLEHIQPKSHGGENGWPNLASAHQTCNAHRGRAPLLAYLLYRRMMRQSRMPPRDTFAPLRGL
jgi:hypothetical protein